MKRLLQLSWTALLLPGCMLPPRTASQPVESDPNAWRMGQNQGEQVLYARDGSPVGSGVPSGVQQGAQPGGPGSMSPIQVSEGPLNHGPAVEQPQGSRVVMLDLYQQAVKDRERLTEELAWSQDEMDKAYNEIEAIEAASGDHDAQLMEANVRIAALEKQVFNIAERLSTSQLRRLEAEKLLLEKTLEHSGDSEASQ